MNKLRLHYLQHVPFEGPGFIKVWARENGFLVSSTALYEDEPLPGAGSFDWLVIMGGPMGVYDEDRCPWLKPEKEFIRAAIDAGKTVIGICLGSQLIAEVLGAKVYPNKEKEIGWFDVALTQEGIACRLLQGFEPQFPVFHWHGDTFDLPPGSERLMTSHACLNQAFLHEDRVLGLQFHIEVTEESLNAMIDNGEQELREEGRWIETGKDILNKANLVARCNTKLDMILNRLLRQEQTG